MRGNVGSLKRDLTTYKTFGKNVESKKYLHGVSDAGTRLLLKFRSGMHGLNEVGIRKIGNVLCVVLSMRVWCMCCGSVWLITQYGSTVYIGMAMGGSAL